MIKEVIFVIGGIIVVAILGLIIGSKVLNDKEEKDPNYSSNGISRKRPTELGIKYGIQECERISQNGNKYFVLLYPESVQKIIVEKYVKR